MVLDLMQKREKRRWLFRRAPSNTHEHQREATNNSAPLMNAQCLAADRRHAIAVATATVAAAEAAAATAQAAVEIIRLTTPSSTSLREHNAAIVIQTCFRGYLVSNKNIKYMPFLSAAYVGVLVPMLLRSPKSFLGSKYYKSEDMKFYKNWIKSIMSFITTCKAYVVAVCLDI